MATINMETLKCSSITEDFCSRSPVGNNGIKRHAKKITAGI
jgi:hypothetical protein